MTNYKMTDSAISQSMQIAIYQHKEGTSTSYFWQSGSRIMPNRLSISSHDMASVQRKGRNLQHTNIGQLLGKFTKVEESPLKQYKPYSVRTQLWQVPAHPEFIGYGTLGITGVSGKVEGDTGDLVVLHTSDEWESITIYYFAGIGSLDGLQQAMQFLGEHVEEVKTKNEGSASQCPLQDEL